MALLEVKNLGISFGGLKDYRMLIYSIVLIVMMLFNWAPKCIEMRQRIAAKFKKPAKKEAA